MESILGSGLGRLFSYLVNEYIRQQVFGAERSLTCGSSVGRDLVLAGQLCIGGLVVLLNPVHDYL
jgi:hypothetical protein